MKTNDIYWATIAWDGFDDQTQGERTITRFTMSDLVEGVQEHLIEFESRHPYIECASIVVKDTNKDEVVTERDLTETVKTIVQIKASKNNGSK